VLLLLPFALLQAARTGKARHRYHFHVDVPRARISHEMRREGEGKPGIGARSRGSKGEAARRFFRARYARRDCDISTGLGARETFGGGGGGTLLGFSEIRGKIS